jgi:hypothetical protein
MSALEWRCRWLLHAYPAWYRRQRGEEMLGTLMDASPAGRRWPSLGDIRAVGVAVLGTCALWRLRRQAVL